jgi:hypothetical protein
MLLAVLASLALLGRRQAERTAPAPAAAAAKR